MWRWMRIALVGFMVFTSFTAPLAPQAAPPITWATLLLIAALGFVGLVAVIGLQSKNPFSDRFWSRPSWAANPFDFGNPLQFFHLAGVAFVAYGAVLAARQALSGLGIHPETFLPLVMGVCVLASVRLSERIYRHKLAPDNSLKRTDQSLRD